MAKVRARRDSHDASLRFFIDLPADLTDSEACALFNAAWCIKADFELAREQILDGAVLKTKTAKRVLEIDAQIRLLGAVVDLLRLRPARPKKGKRSRK